ncbi:MAG: flagellar basal body protein [Salinibacter sp.]|jgi:Flagellar basal body protein|uniref:flagellar basal body rod protein FlgB n=1 Tax=Salinibacter sp. TaxID=2065818 RepID=UPI002FC3CC23
METTNVRLLRNAMSAYTQRRRAASSNLANVDTPGYNRMSVSFEEKLQQARRHSGSLREQSEVEANMEVEDGPPVLEDELMALTDTQMRTRLASRALTEHFDLMRMGITGSAR